MVGPTAVRPEPEGRLDDTARGWWVTITLTVIAAVTRFVRLGSVTDAGLPVFDEKYYALQAWDMLHNGMGIEDNPGYVVVVHPPAGKLLIAIGEVLFGYSPLGWRFSAAVAGTVLVLLVIRIVRRLARSTLIGAIAGILMITDGVTLVSSRIGMLDIFLAVLVTGAFGCLVVDRDEVRTRMAAVEAAGRIQLSPFGPRLGVRWWRFSAGVLLGLACGTKWSGAYFMVVFVILCLSFDVVARRRHGVLRPFVGTIVRDAAPAVFALIIVAIGVYLGSYAGWFASESAINRHAVGIQVGHGGFFSLVPEALRSLWFQHGAVLEVHTHLTNSAGFHHPWESKPWTWPMGLRPMLYHFPEPGQTTGCGQSACVRAIMLIGTPALWWLALPAVGWALWQSVTRRDWRYLAVLAGYAAGWLPWFAVLDRQMYYFYATAMAPFLVMLVALALGQLLGRATESSERRGTGLLLVCLYLGLVIANFAWNYPILTALPITLSTWQQHLWLPSWH
ncbi:dolichyl-phosphate-mannose--protein mannosyltransferase [Nocardia sp. CA-128927]|uniref:dolichyl-phosphate-mannose--protein mannosyltransferase n=1 Tax=Nocardia sp. CA-128927 TaxID=3239975 RepID=UPI003D9664B4